MQSPRGTAMAYEQYLDGFHRRPAAAGPDSLFNTADPRARAITRLTVPNPLASYARHLAPKPLSGAAKGAGEGRPEESPVVKGVNEVFRAAMTHLYLSGPTLSFYGVIHLRVAVYSEALEAQMMVVKHYAKKHHAQGLLNVDSMKDDSKAGDPDALARHIDKLLNSAEEKRRFRSSRLQSMQRLLLKNMDALAGSTPPLISAVDRLRRYLCGMLADSKLEHRKRCKAMACLLLLAMGHTAARDVALALRGLLFLVPAAGGKDRDVPSIVLKSDVIKRLLACSKHIQTRHRLQRISGTPWGDWDVEGLLPPPSGRKKHVQANTLFAWVLAHVDGMGQSLPAGRGVQKWPLVLEVHPSTFDLLTDVTNALLHTPWLPCDEPTKREYVLIVLRMLQRNVEALEVGDPPGPLRRASDGAVAPLNLSTFNTSVYFNPATPSQGGSALPIVRKVRAVVDDALQRLQATGRLPGLNAVAGLAAALNAVQCCLFPLLYPAAEERKALLLTYLEPLIQGVSVANLGFLTAVFEYLVQNWAHLAPLIRSVTGASRRPLPGGETDSQSSPHRKTGEPPLSSSSIPPTRRGSPEKQLESSQLFTVTLLALAAQNAKDTLQRIPHVTGNPDSHALCPLVLRFLSAWQMDLMSNLYAVVGAAPGLLDPPPGPSPDDDEAEDEDEGGEVEALTAEERGTVTDDSDASSGEEGDGLEAADVSDARPFSVVSQQPSVPVPPTAPNSWEAGASPFHPNPLLSTPEPPRGHAPRPPSGGGGGDAPAAPKPSSSRRSVSAPMRRRPASAAQRSTTPGPSTEISRTMNLSMPPMFVLMKPISDPMSQETLDVLRDHVAMLAAHCLELLHHATEAVRHRPDHRAAVDAVCAESLVGRVMLPLAIGLVKVLCGTKPAGKSEDALAAQLFDPLAIPPQDFTHRLLPYFSVLLQGVSRFTEALQLPRGPPDTKTLIPSLEGAPEAVHYTFPNAAFVMGQLDVQGKVDQGITVVVTDGAGSSSHVWDCTPGLKPVCVVRGTSVACTVRVPKFSLLNPGRLALTFTGIRAPHWAAELEATLAWLVGRLTAAVMVQRRPARDPTLAPLLASLLFANGLQADAVPEEEHDQQLAEQRIRAVLELRAGGACYGPDKATHRWLLDFQAGAEAAGHLVRQAEQQAAQAAPGMPLPEVAVAAERSIVAAALKHAKLLGRCIAVSEALQKGQKSPDATEVLAQTKAICVQVRRKLRPWLVEQHQQHRQRYPDLAQDVQHRASLLLLLAPCTATAAKVLVDVVADSPTQARGKGLLGVGDLEHSNSLEQQARHPGRKSLLPPPSPSSSPHSAAVIHLNGLPYTCPTPQDADLVLRSVHAQLCPTLADPDLATSSGGGSPLALRQWEQGPDEDAAANVEACLGPILGFVTAGEKGGRAARGAPSVVDLYHLLEWRRYCAIQRAEAFLSYSLLLRCAPGSGPRCIVLGPLSPLMRSVLARAPTLGQPVDHHWLSGLEGAGLPFHKAAHLAAQALLATVLQDLQAFAEHQCEAEATEHYNRRPSLVDMDPEQESWFTVILDLLLATYQPADILWLLQADVWNLVFPFTYVERPAGDAAAAARPTLARKAMQLIRMLLLRIVGILEAWDAGDRYQLALPEGPGRPPSQAAAHTRLVRVRDSMFGHLLTEMEWLAGQATLTTPMQMVLHDCVSILLCVASSPMAQPCLQGRRCHALLIAILQGPPRGQVQELALTLLLQLLLAPPPPASAPAAGGKRFQTDQSLSPEACRALLASLLDMLGAVELLPLTPPGRPGSPASDRPAAELQKHAALCTVHVETELRRFWQALLLGEGAPAWQAGARQLLADSLLEVGHTLGQLGQRGNPQPVQRLLGTLSVLLGPNRPPRPGDDVLVFCGEYQRTVTGSQARQAPTVPLPVPTTLPIGPGLPPPPDHTPSPRKDRMRDILTTQAAQVVKKGDTRVVLAPVTPRWEKRWVPGKVVGFDRHTNTASVELPGCAAPLPVELEDLRFASQAPDLTDLQVLTEKHVAALWRAAGTLMPDAAPRDATAEAHATAALRAYVLYRSQKLLCLALEGNPVLAAHAVAMEAEMKTLIAHARTPTVFQYGKPYKLRSCTATLTGPTAARQVLYACYTCKRTAESAVCAFCAQVCHRGHKLGPMEVGDLSCGCGGKKLQCVGRQHQPPAPPLSLDREEAQTMLLMTALDAFWHTGADPVAPALPVAFDPVAELRAGGYAADDIAAALARFEADAGCAESCLAYARTPHPTDPRAVLEGMGFAPDDCRTALARCGNDPQLAATYLLEIGSLPGAPPPAAEGPRPVWEGAAAGGALLGLDLPDTFLSRLCSLAILEGLLKPVPVEAPLSAPLPLPADAATEGHFVGLVPVPSSTSGRLGVIVARAAADGAISVALCEPHREGQASTTNALQTALDPCSAEVACPATSSQTLRTLSVKPQQLTSPPSPFAGLRLAEVLPAVRQRHSSLAVAYSRRILRCLLTQLPTHAVRAITPPFAGLSLPTATPLDVYQLLKLLLLDVYYTDYPCFNSTGLDLSRHRQAQALMAALPALYVHCLPSAAAATTAATQPLWRVALTGALHDMEVMCEAHPHLRLVAYSPEIQNKPQRVHFPAASAVALIFTEGCGLPTSRDSLTFYLDAQCSRPAMALVGPVQPGTLQNPQYVRVLPCSTFWYVFRSSGGAGLKSFSFHVALVSLAAPEPALLTAPNMALAASVLTTVAAAPECALTSGDVMVIWAAAMRYLLMPFAPYKGQVATALQTLFHRCYSGPAKAAALPLPATPPLQTLRVELEVLMARQAMPRPPTARPALSPSVYCLIDFLASLRMILVADLCPAMFPRTGFAPLIHTYRCSIGDPPKAVAMCCACAQVAAMRDKEVVPLYAGVSSNLCQGGLATQLQWQKAVDLVPHKPGQWVVHPSDWFEHVGWLDQVAIARSTAEVFAVAGLRLPPWALYEAALEAGKFVVEHESPHPYSTVYAVGEIRIPGAQSLFIAFDKQSRTHRCDCILFSRVKCGKADVATVGGSDLGSRTLVVSGDVVYYQFQSMELEHDGVVCDSCRSVISGIRFHCTVCDDYDLCSKCIDKDRVHPPTHIFLKLRRPVDCLPAALPILYPTKYLTTSLFKSDTHINVRCNGCSMFPIIGVRYWCENCVDFNLCEVCAQEECRHHDRLHVFLRVKHPLPRTLPANALPYGLLYDKDADVHWGYLFRVTGSMASSDVPGFAAPLMEQMASDEAKWDPASDGQLLALMEAHTKQEGWAALSPEEQAEVAARAADRYPALLARPPAALRLRYTLLRLLNRKVARLLGASDRVDPSNLYPFLPPAGPEDAAGGRLSAARLQPLPKLLRCLRTSLFPAIKTNAFTVCLQATDTDCRPIELRINRHKGTVPEPPPAPAGDALAEAAPGLPTVRQSTHADPATSQAQVSGGVWHTASTKAVPKEFMGPDGKDVRVTSFHQAFAQLHSTDCFLLRRRKGAWKVTFIGEASDDYGGPFRESLTVMCNELQSEALDVLVPVPNAANDVGSNREKWIVNTSNPQLGLYHFIGVLMGVAVRSKTVIPLDLPSIVWKQLTLQDLTAQDLEAIDQLAYQSVKMMSEVNDAEECAVVYGDAILDAFQTQSVTGTVVPLVPDAHRIPVTFTNKDLFAQLALSFKLEECRRHTAALLRGLASILPPQYFALFTWHELEAMVCGEPEVDIELLRRHTIYEGYQHSSPHIKDFWAVLADFDTPQRSLFLKFVWGRARLAVTEDAFATPMKIQRLAKPDPDKFLPLSHTCFFSLELPPYSSREVMAQRLLYAITHCQAIDTDFTTAALDSRDAGWNA